ncbi:MAG: hypothetical protein ACFFAJ_15525 [Candidatus Hodarchaeota archaeon]
MDNTDKVLISGIIICFTLICLLLISDNSDIPFPQKTPLDDVSIIYNCSGDQSVGEESSYFFTIRNDGNVTISIDVVIKVNESNLANQKNVSIAASPFKNSVEYDFHLSFDIAGYYIFTVLVSKANFTKIGTFTTKINST